MRNAKIGILGMTALGLVALLLLAGNASAAGAPRAYGTVERASNAVDTASFVNSPSLHNAGVLTATYLAFKPLYWPCGVMAVSGFMAGPVTGVATLAMGSICWGGVWLAESAVSGHFWQGDGWARTAR